MYDFSLIFQWNIKSDLRMPKSGVDSVLIVGWWVGFGVQ